MSRRFGGCTDGGSADGLAPAVEVRKESVEPAATQDIAIAIRQSADPHHAVASADPSLQLDELSDQPGVEHGHLAQVEHHAMREALLEELPHAFGQRRV